MPNIFLGSKSQDMTMYFYIGFHLMLTMASVSLHESGTLEVTGWKTQNHPVTEILVTCENTKV